jgi:RNA polymerase sigma-70 factor (ECF subfamily)
MTAEDWLAGEFERQRSRLHAVAVRLLGSSADADDAVQEAWLRLHRSGPDGIDNLGGWLTTVVARVALDQLRSRRTRREVPAEEDAPVAESRPGPEDQAVSAEALGTALLLVLETLAPAERTAFVLHDLFAVPFEEIAAIVGRSVPATRQLASRARRRVQGQPDPGEADRRRRREVVAAFLAASREGDFARLVELLDPDATLTADPAAAAMGATTALGGDAVAKVFAGRAQGARPALVDGAPGAVWMVGPQVKIGFAFRIAGGRVAGIELVADPARLAAAEIELDG